MRSSYFYLLSGVSNTATGYFPCVGIDKFSILYNTNNTGAFQATGSVLISAKVAPSSAYSNLAAANFTVPGAGPTILNLSNPVDTLSAIVYNVTGGTMDVVCAYSYPKE